MTICEKLNFMIRCFEDIKLAITEMGGIISGGYSSYPNGIRSIYQKNIDFGNISEYPSYGTTEQKTAFCLEIIYAFVLLKFSDSKISFAYFLNSYSYIRFLP